MASLRLVHAKVLEGVRLRLRFAAAAASIVLCACTAHNPHATGTPSPLPVATGAYPMHGHAPDFTWIAGTVERDLRCVYLDLSGSGRSGFASRIALVTTSDQAAQLQAGDTVVIKGALSQLAYGTCGAPSYRVASIEEH